MVDEEEAPIKNCAQTSAIDFEDQNPFTMGNDDSDAASLFVGDGSLLKTDSGFPDRGGGEFRSSAGKSTMSHPPNLN